MKTLITTKHKNSDSPSKGGTQNNKTKDKANGIVPKKLYGRYRLGEDVLSAK